MHLEEAIALSSEPKLAAQRIDRVRGLSLDELGSLMTKIWNSDSIDRQGMEVVVLKALDLAALKRSGQSNMVATMESTETRAGEPSRLADATALESATDVEADLAEQSTVVPATKRGRCDGDDDGEVERTLRKRGRPKQMNPSCGKPIKHEDDTEMLTQHTSNGESQQSDDRAPIHPAADAPIRIHALNSNIPAMNLVIWLPNQKNKYRKGSWAPADTLSASVSSHLVSLFTEHYLSDDRLSWYGRWYRMVSGSGGDPANKTRCVGNMVYVRLSRPSMYTKGDITGACDNCANNGRLCVKLVRERTSSSSKLGLYPLPASMRGRASWDEIGFWVKV